MKEGLSGSRILGMACVLPAPESTSSQTSGEEPEEVLLSHRHSGSQPRAEQGWAALRTVDRTGQRP